MCRALLQAVGFALIYWCGFPRRCFRRKTPSVDDTVLLLEVTTTLRFGDILPKTRWIRLLMTLQALTGLIRSHSTGVDFIHSPIT